MKREIERKKINGLWRCLIRLGAAMIIAVGLVPGTLSPALADTNRGATFAAGYSHSCVVLIDGRVQCWGGNQNGQLGNGSKSDFSWAPVTVSGITNAVAVAAGGDHTCALLADGKVQCWGENRFGQLGNAPWGAKSSVPVAVIGITDATAVAAGWEHSCAILSDGRVTCWGLKKRDDKTVTVDVVVPVSGITNAIALAGGGQHTCAVLSDGRVQCWGVNTRGQLGNGTTTDSLVPVSVSGITNAVAVASGFEHSCVLLTDGHVLCWGVKVTGNTNETVNLSVSLDPETVSGVTNAVAIAGGHHHSCALMADGRVKCWGANPGGQLGDGTTISSLVSVPVSGISNAVAIATGGCQYSCVILVDGTVWCWGHVHFETVGNRIMSATSVPINVSGLAAAVALVPRVARSSK